MVNVMLVLGLIGAALVVGMYLALEQGRVKSTDMKFYILNGTGAALVFASILYDYDPGDMGGLLVEGLWVVISLMGVAKILRKGQTNA